MPHLVVIGAGGHARVLIDALRLAGQETSGVLDPQRSQGESFAGVEVLGGDEWLAGYSGAEVILVNGLGANPAIAGRQTLFTIWQERGYAFAAVHHPSAVVAPDARLGEGCQILARSVLQPGVVLAENVVINTGAVIEHNCELAAHVFIAPGVIICGDVRVGVGAFIGAGSVLLPGVQVGPGAVIAAGSVVVRDVGAGAQVFGVPGKEKKQCDKRLR